LIMDNADPRWVWYAAVLVGLAAAGSFILLNRRVEGSTQQAPQAIIGEKPQAQATPAQ